MSPPSRSRRALGAAAALAAGAAVAPVQAAVPADRAALQARVDAVRLALQDRPNVRVIFVSGYAEDCLSEDQARIPNSVFLPKPFSLNDLTTTVQGQFH